MFEDFFRDIDRHWRGASAGAKIPLRIIGSTALMLRASYVRGTKDSGVVRTSDVTEDVAEQLIAVAGPDTALHTRHRLYVQLVHGGILFRRQVVQWHPLVSLLALGSLASDVAIRVIRADASLPLLICSRRTARHGTRQ